MIAKFKDDRYTRKKRIKPYVLASLYTHMCLHKYIIDYIKTDGAIGKTVIPCKKMSKKMMVYVKKKDGRKISL